MCVVICGRKIIDKKIIIIRKGGGDRTEPWVTLLLVGKEGEVEPSIITEIQWLQKELAVREQSEGEKPKEWRLEIRPWYRALSKVFEIWRAITKDSPKSHREKDQTFIIQERISLVDLALRKPYWSWERRPWDWRCLRKGELRRRSKSLEIVKVRAIGQ